MRDVGWCKKCNGKMFGEEVTHFDGFCEYCFSTQRTYSIHLENTDEYVRDEISISEVYHYLKDCSEYHRHFLNISQSCGEETEGHMRGDEAYTMIKSSLENMTLF